MIDVIGWIGSLGVVPLVEITDAELAVPLADALARGGLPCVEVAFRTPAAVDSIAAIHRSRPDVLVGAGTVLSVDQVEVALEVGARFIVSPGLDPAIVERCLEQSVTVIPGAVTATEVQMARSRGIDTLKFFPAEAAGGVAYLKALAGPFRDTRFIPTGGINLMNLESYLAIPGVIAVGGSWIAPPDVLRSSEFDVIERRAHDAVELVRRLRPLPAFSDPLATTTAGEYRWRR